MEGFYACLFGKLDSIAIHASRADDFRLVAEECSLVWILALSVVYSPCLNSKGENIYTSPCYLSN